MYAISNIREQNFFVNFANFSKIREWNILSRREMIFFFTFFYVQYNVWQIKMLVSDIIIQENHSFPKEGCNIAKHGLKV